MSNAFPTLENCDQSNPKEWMAWAHMAIPWFGGVSLNLDDELISLWCEYYWDLGFRHHPELMTKKILPPSRGPQHRLNPASTVVSVDDDDNPPIRLQDPELLTEDERRATLDRYRQLGYLEENYGLPERDMTLNHFDPKDHPSNTVIGYLMGCTDPAEKSRVIASEMAGKRRKSILNKEEFRGL